MKKYYIKPVVIFSIMISMVIGFNFLSKDKMKIETVSGNLSQMGDVKLVYTPAISDLKREEIELSKDGIKSYTSDSYVLGRDFIEVDKVYNDFIKFIPNNQVFQNDKYIGTLRLKSEEDKYSFKGYYIEVKLKNKKDNKETSYNIPINQEDSKNLVEVSLDYIYLYEEFIYIIGVDDESMFIAQIDLNNSSYKIIKRIDEFEYNIRNMIVLSYNDSIYIEVNSEKSDFLIYDIKENRLYENNDFKHNLSRIDNNEKEYIIDVVLKNNELDIIALKKSKIVKYEYIINNNSVKIKDILEYDFNPGFDDYIYGEFNGYYEGESGIRKINVIDNKIYTLHQRVGYTSVLLENEEFPNSIQGNKPIEFKIFDMNKNELVYEANLTTNEKYLLECKFHFVK